MDINTMSDYQILRGIDEQLLELKEEVRRYIVKYNRLLRARNAVTDRCFDLGIDGCASDDQCQIRGGGCGSSDAEENLLLEEEEILRGLGYNPEILIL